MKSIKPGRGPSFMGGISAIFAALFGVFWVIMACAMGGWFMAPFGLIFIAIAVVNAIHSFKNATGENRYSAFDIVDSEEEPDPLNLKYGKPVSNVVESKNKPEQSNQTEPSGTTKDTEKTENRYCPWCGTKVDGDYVFCNACGKKLP